MLNNYVAVRGLLAIRTNSKYIGWSFGHPSKTSSQEEFDQCRIRLTLMVDKLNEKSKEFMPLEKYHYWRGEPGRDELFYERNFFCGTKLRMYVKGLATNTPEMRVNKNFLRFIKFRFNNLHSPGYLLTDLVCVLLLRDNFCPLHCSAFSIGDATVAVVAPGDTGKTLTTMRAVFDAGASYLSEDLGIVDSETFYACPWTSTFRYYDELSMSWLLRWRMRLIKIFPPVELIPVPGDSRTIDSYIEKERILASKKLTHLAFLARRPGGIEVLDKKRAFHMLTNLNRFEFMYMKSPVLNAYSYFNPEMVIHDMVEKEREILGQIVERNTCLLVQSEDPRRFSDLILEKIGQ